MNSEATVRDGKVSKLEQSIRYNSRLQASLVSHI